MIDYYQLITKTIKNPSASSYEALNGLRMWFGKYIKNSNIPIVLFAQLHSIGKRNNKDLDSRIKDCPAVYEPSTVVIEVIPDFNLKTSKFLIHKDRFGAAGHQIECAFDRGRFIPLTEGHLAKVQDDRVDDLIKQSGVVDEEEDDESNV
jgi:hypothetical protein